jgi:pimeloyl-ACP methyl ester carboxylesterase
LLSNGVVDISAFPDPANVSLIEQSRGIVASDAHGFSTMGGIFFSLSGALADPTLAAGTVVTDHLARVINLASGDEVPVRLWFAADGGPFGAANLLTVLPVQGFPLRPASRCAAVLFKHTGTRSILRATSEMQQLLSGARPKAMTAAVFTEYRQAIQRLAALHLDTDDIAGLAVFTTDDPTSGIAPKLAAAPPVPVPQSFTNGEDFPGYCVRNAMTAFAGFQSGTPPYGAPADGGAWQDTVQRTEASRVVITIPKTPMPAGGYPLVVFVRTGGGGDRPLVDRGVQAVEGGPPITPGSGPAQEFAAVGYAGLQVDGPLGGIRNPTGADEEFLVFNFFNGQALRDNLRQSALELALLARTLGDYRVPDCTGATVQFDTAHVAIMGHSMGAWIAPITLAESPQFGATILSGAGGSMIENIIFKQQPIAVLPLAEAWVGVANLTEFDPAVSLVEWAIEPGDSSVYAPQAQRSHVLMLQGFVDHYIPPPVANALSLSLGLDLAGEALDQAIPETAVLETLVPLLPLAGRAQIAFPAQGNRTLTRVVVQNRGDSIEDGHETAFQTEPPKQQYRCYLQTWLSGAPVVVSPTTTSCP